MSRGTVIGVVGAGQLGRMLHQAAIGPGISLRFLADRTDDAAVQVCPDHELGAATDPAALTRFAATVDVLTFEHELVDVGTLDRLAAGGSIVRPGADALRVVADKLVMRAALEGAGLPVPHWRRADSVDEVLDAVAQWPDAVVKLSRGGYDGRGVFMVSGVEQARAVATEVLRSGVPLLIEPRLTFTTEAAIIVARRPGGETVVYDPVATLQVDGQCRQVAMPADLAPALATRAGEIARAAAASLDVVGLLAVELFLVDGDLIVNELAVRPHNTGHHSIEACVTSQFENHLRAVADLPLGDPAATTPAAAMVNIIGAADGSDPRHRLALAMAADPGAHIHLYGKPARPERKLGHVTVCDTDTTSACRRAWTVVEVLGAAIPAEISSQW